MCPVADLFSDIYGGCNSIYNSMLGAHVRRYTVLNWIDGHLWWHVCEVRTDFASTCLGKPVGFSRSKSGGFKSPGDFGDTGLSQKTTILGGWGPPLSK